MSSPRHANRQPLDRSWRVWDLDAETRYWPVLGELPESELPICEIGSGLAGLATWTDRTVVGVDPGDDVRHEDLEPLRNLVRVRGSGTAVPLDGEVVCASVAVDTFEHIPPTSRPAVVGEMIRVTAPGGRVIITGPSGPDAAAGDRWLIDALSRRGPRPPWSEWLDEHLEHGLPSEDELVGLLDHPRVARVSTRGVMPLAHWRLMHRIAMGAVRVPGRTQPALLSPLRRRAHRSARGPFYRLLVVADLGDETSGAGLR